MLNQVAAFDADNQQVFTFIVPAGSDQVVANRLIIKKATDDIEIFNEKITTFAYSHILPASTLTNGVQYNAYVITYNNAGDASEQSLPLQFWCYSAPTFEITNIPSGNIISNNSYSFELTYNQAEQEKINGYVYTLYDDEHTQIATSGEQYIDEAPPNIFYHIFDGFTDKQTYYIQASGQTVNGTNIQTPEYQFLVNFIQPSIYTQLTLTSNCEGGYVTISSSTLSIDGVSVPEEPIYVDNNTAVDVTADGSYVGWMQGYELSGDFEVQIWGKNFTPNTNVLEMIDGIGNSVKMGYHGTYFDLTVKTARNIYYIISDTFAQPASTANITVRIRRVDGLYSIEIDGV